MLILLSLLPGLTIFPINLQANPRGANVRAGNVNFQGLGTANLNINNNSNRAIINWQSFSIDKGEITRINQSNKSFTLNRVVSGNPTAIYGQLKAAKGGVAVINPNGIVVHQGGSVDVAGMLTMSTLDISDNDFLNGGSNRFRGSTNAGIENYGTISSASGDVVLLGNFLRNAGSVSAPGGTVAFGAGGDIVVDHTASGGKISVLAGGAGGATGIDNSGTISGAAAELKAHGNVYALAIKNDGIVRASGYNFAGGKLTLSAGSRGSIINTGQLSARNSDGSGGRVAISGGNVQLLGGSVDASGAAGMNGGEVDINGSNVTIGSQAEVLASGSVGGSVRITGSGTTSLNGAVDVSGSSGVGGTAIVEGRNVQVGNQAVIDASGDQGGGEVFVGGGFQGRDASISNAETLSVAEGSVVIADAGSSGEGGNVILWSDGNTLFEGNLSAAGVSKGGFAEISGRQTLSVSGDVDLSASDGAYGTLLLDPTDITISALGDPGLGGSTISNVWLSDQLDQGTNVVISTLSGDAESGHITVGRLSTQPDAAADRVEWYQDDVGTPGGTLSLLATGNINFNTSVRSAGEGGINVVAGWDGVTGFTGPSDFNMADVLATMNDGDVSNDAAGLFGASVYLGDVGAQTAVEVGSRWGETNVAARDLFIQGSITRNRGWAQLGFHDSGAEYELGREWNSGRNEWWGSTLGNVQGKDYIALLGGTEFGTGDTNVLGHNAFRGAGWGATGDIEVGLSGRLDMRGGNTYSNSQIGHGSNNAEGVEYKWSSRSDGTVPNANYYLSSTMSTTMTTRDGIQINPGDNRRSFYASTWRTNYAGDAARIDGDITVNADGDILVMAARGFDVGDTIDVSTNNTIYSLIGHGGAENQGSFHGDISVTAHGSTPAGFARGPEGIGIQLLGGRSTRSFAQIGHGSAYEGNRRSVWDQTRSGNVTVTATTGAIRAQGHNQAIREGDLNFGPIVPEGTPTPLNNASDSSTLSAYVQIGHGGQASSYSAAGGTFTMPGGTNVGNIEPDASISGHITVYADGTYVDPTDPDATELGIKFQAGNRRWFYAMIGHGGTNHNADRTTAQTPDFGAAAMTPFGTPTLAANTGFNGDVHVEADKGDIIVAGGDSFRADRPWGWGYNFARVGHGGDLARGNKDGTITVLAGQGAGAVGGNIRFSSGRMNRSHAQLGHGGYDGDSAILGTGENSAEIIVTAREDISFVSQKAGETDALGISTDYANYYFGRTSPTSGNYGTENRWVLLGHGGDNSTTVMPDRQDITVTSGTGDVGNADGDTDTGGILFVAGDSNQSFAQLGHGGRSSSANNAAGFTGDITVTANGGGIRFDGSVLGIQAAARPTDVSLDGIAVAGTPQYTVGGRGRGVESYVHLGHGGYASRGVHTGEINIDAWGGIEFLGAQAAPEVDRSVDSAPIDAAVNAGTNVWIQLANLRDTAATVAAAFQMPEIYSNVVPGSVTITLDDGAGTVVVITDTPDAGSDERTSFLFRESDGAQVGEINYDNGTVRFTGSDLTGAWTGTGATATFRTAQGLKERAYVQLGHGGYESDGPNNKANDQPGNSGNITINAAGDFRFEGAAWHRAYSQLGHGGYGNRGAHSGDIVIDHIDEGNPLGEVGGLHFIAGHGGHRQFDYQNYTQLGHGGYEADGNHFGNITVRGTQDVDGIGLLVKAGDRQDATAQVGHGGRSARSGTGNGDLSFGLNGDIDIEVGGDVAFVAGTLTKSNPLYNDDGRQYAMLGHGGWDADPSNNNDNNYGQRGDDSIPIGTAGAGDGNWGHFGDISLVTSQGDISFMAGSNIAVADRVDQNGNPLPIDDPNGILTGFGEGGGRVLTAQLGHGGYAAGGDHRGNITAITQDGSVNVVGGILTAENSGDRYHWATIGHGAGNDDGNLGQADEVITVQALGENGDLVVMGGEANATAASIGHGMWGNDGDKLGDIEIVVGNNLYMDSGLAGSNTNGSKIGHGDPWVPGAGDNDGNIHVSVGESAYLGDATIGHIDPSRNSGFVGFRDGNTYIAVSRNDPYAGADGEFITTDETVFSSAGNGFTDDELRLYMPDSSWNMIAEGTYLNPISYTRTPPPGDPSRPDEREAVEHQFSDPFTDASAEFTPEGDYGGFYAIYYAGEAPPEAPDPVPVDPVPADPVTSDPTDPVDSTEPGFDFTGIFFSDQYDAYERGDDLLDTEVAGEQHSLLDVLGEDDNEDDNEDDRRRKRYSRYGTPVGLTYYTFDPATNKYSSYRVFGTQLQGVPKSQ